MVSAASQGNSQVAAVVPGGGEAAVDIQEPVHSANSREQPLAKGGNIVYNKH